MCVDSDEAFAVRYCKIQDDGFIYLFYSQNSEVNIVGSSIYVYI